MNLPETPPFFSYSFTVERLYQCLAFIYQPEPTLFISLSQVAQEKKSTNMASNSHLVIYSANQSTQMYTKGVQWVKKQMLCLFFFSFLSLISIFEPDLFCLSSFSYLKPRYLETQVARSRSWADLASTSCSWWKQQQEIFKNKNKNKIRDRNLVLEGARREKSDRLFLRSTHDVYAMHMERWQDRHVYRGIFTASIYL